VLTRRIYFGTVGTFGTTQIDRHNRIVPYGMQGSGRYIFDRCQMIASDHIFTESTKHGQVRRYAFQYWVIGMESTCNVENLFNNRTGPVLAVFRGVHAEVENKAALAVDMFAIRQYARDRGILDEECGLVLDQDWHALKVWDDGKCVTLTRDDNDFYIKKENMEAYYKKHGCRVQRATEMVVVLRYSGARGQDATTSPRYKTLKAILSKEYEDFGSYVNLNGLRLERFPGFEQLQRQRVHAEPADVPHTIVIDNITEHILARDLLEELLVDPTQNNWKVLPNATMAFYQPRCDHAWAKCGARLHIVFRHEAEPSKTDDRMNPTLEQREADILARAEYERRTNHFLELDTVTIKYSPPVMGGAMSTLELVDTRSKYIDMGKKYKAYEQLKANSPGFSSPTRKKTKAVNTPEKRMVQGFKTPQSLSTSSSLTLSGDRPTSVEKYVPGDEQMQVIASLTNTVTQMATEMAALKVNMETRAKENDAKHAQTDAKVRSIENNVSQLTSLIGSVTLKNILRQIKDEANKLQSAMDEHAIYERQLNQANTARNQDRMMDIQGKLDICQNQINTHKRSLESLREDAREQAAVEGVGLSDAQLKYVK